MRRLLIYLIILSSSLIIAQEKTNRARLLEISSQKAKEFKIEKAKADSIANANGFFARKTLSNGTEIELMRFENGLPIFYTTDNLDAAVSTSTDKVWENGAGGYNLSGTGITLAVWDGGGVRTTHQEFGNRVVQKDFSSSFSSHSTHVAGTVVAAGVNPAAKGMSYNASLNTYNWSSDESEMASAAASGLQLSNHSYGIPLGWEFNTFDDNKWAWLGDTTVSQVEDYRFGLYTNQTRTWDEIAYEAPFYLINRSAGNERSESGPSNPNNETYWLYAGNQWVLTTGFRLPDGGALGFDCIQEDKVGKNILTVGAVNDVVGGYSDPSSVSMSSFSSWGPTDDGRIKPDIVANGVGLFSTYPGSNTQYASISGTSMSTPATTGSLGLILEHYKNSYQSEPRASTIKGLAIHNADEAGANDGPDYIYGWGLLNTYKAVQFITYDKAMGGNKTLVENKLDNGQELEYTFESNGNEPIKATIVWTDVPGTPISNPGLNNRTPMLVNDLDIRIFSQTNEEFKPWILDPDNPNQAAQNGDNIRDNVEQVYIASPSAGTYTVKINHKGNLENNEQYFSLLISGSALDLPQATVTVSPTNDQLGVDYLNAVLEWERSDLAQYYELQISTDNQFNNLVIDEEFSTVKAVISELPDNTELFWRVKAKNNGGESAWSNVSKFKTKIAYPAQVELISPLYNEVDIPLETEFKWKSESRSESYNFEVAKNLLFLSFIEKVENLTDTAYTVSNLPDGSKLYWRVRGVNTTGEGNNSVGIFFTILNAPDSLQALEQSGDVLLTWKDNNINESNFVVQRKEGNGQFAAIDTLAKNSVEYLDTKSFSDPNLTYRIYTSNNLTESEFSSEVSILVTSINDEFQIPQQYSLLQNYPNPFNPATVIKFGLAKESSVTVRIFNLLGENIATLVNNEVKSAGSYNLNFNAQNLASGIYFYEISANAIDGSENFNSIKKMLLLK